MVASLTWRGFGLRWLAAFTLVLLTFNPLHWSYFHWVAALEEDNLALKALCGVILLGGYVVYFRATARSLGRVGSVIILVIFGLMLWLLMDEGIVPRDSRVLLWVFEFILATFLAIGMTGSFMWRRLTGQYQVAEDDMGDGD